ncbi:hypothetical protein L0U95_30410 (plasmid) [Burkholderia cenocepacia]|nr:hypothetical protein [Burkholderia cenocepacia]UJH76202.1 hypothetical protein L0U95_30410 [Burkholderia cenocepacia]
MLKKITDRISAFGVGRTPVGSFFLLVVFGAFALVVLVTYPHPSRSTTF